MNDEIDPKECTQVIPRSWIAAFGLGHRIPADDSVKVIEVFYAKPHDGKFALAYRADRLLLMPGHSLTPHESTAILAEWESQRLEHFRKYWESHHG